MDEAMRHRIHGRFEEQLGAEEAAAVMTARTPSSSIDERFDRLERQLFELRSEVNQLYRWTHDRAGGNMALDEAMRHRIHGRLEELLGHDEAAALLEPRQPVAHRHHVTGRDLDRARWGRIGRERRWRRGHRR